jgi:dCMP deaminase
MCPSTTTSLRKRKRIDFETYAMCLAWMASLRSEDPYLQVGAVAFDGRNRVLSTGYNGLKPGASLSDAEWKQRDQRLPFIIHAETNCLAVCTLGTVETIAVTTQPCAACASNIVAHGIKTVLYGKPYHRDDSSFSIFERYGVRVKHIPLEKVIAVVTRRCEYDNKQSDADRVG